MHTVDTNLCELFLIVTNSSSAYGELQRARASYTYCRDKGNNIAASRHAFFNVCRKAATLEIAQGRPDLSDHKLIMVAMQALAEQCEAGRPFGEYQGADND